jgi:NADPH2:quinone reductase
MVGKVVAIAYGGPEVLALIDEAVVAPGPGEVLLEVRAAGTNPIDYKLYSGDFGRDPARLPMSLGMEASGVVVAVGAGASGPAGAIEPGHEVIAYPAFGAYAGQMLVPGSAVVPKPTALSFAQASGLLLTGVTAVHALAAVGVSEGDVVVIHGASGGVGLMAVQLAVAQGAIVIGTASAGSHAELRRLGAEPVAYGEGLVDRIRALTPSGVDAAIDAVGTEEALQASLELVEDRQRVATLAASKRALELGLKALGGAPGADPGTEIREAARLQLVQQAEQGRIEVTVAATYALSDAAEAHRQLATGHTHGKIVLIP